MAITVRKTEAAIDVQPVTLSSNLWLLIIAISCGIGSIFLAIANQAGRLNLFWSDIVFWLGLLLIFVPCFIGIMSTQAQRNVRLLIVIWLGTALYIAKMLGYPIAFTFTDELQHLVTAQDILTTGHLFQQNPILPISPWYPGLEIVVSAVSNMTGLSVFWSGAIIIGIARLVFMLGLFLLFEVVSGSSRAAGLAAGLYAANPQFLFFDAQFAYESLGIAFAIVILYLVAYRSQVPGRQTKLTVVIYAAVAALTITHHVTSYVLVIILGIWSLIWLVSPQSRGQGLGPIFIALFCLELAFAWLMFTGDLALGYLAPNFTGAVTQITQILNGNNASRPLFTDGAGYVAPLWERVTSIAAVLLILIGSAIGILALLRARLRSAPVLCLGIVSLGYPISQALRITPEGITFAGRATAFIFIALVFVIAVGIILLMQFARKPFYRLAIVLCATVVFCGGVVAGNGPVWSRLPGPYLVEAASRSVDFESTAAATWADAYLRAGKSMASDRQNVYLMAAIGRQHVVGTQSGTNNIALLFTSATIDTTDIQLMMDHTVTYLEVDDRLSTNLPHAGFYFDASEPNGNNYKTPISRSVLDKYDGASGVDRIYDSGDIAIYDVAGLYA